MERTIERVAVIGAGTMGHGIAQVSAMAGRDTTLVDVDRDRVEAGLDRIRENLDKGIDRGKVTQEQRAGTLERLRGETDLGRAAEGVGLVIEAVPEKFELKIQVFAELDEHAPPEAVLATNTSSLSVTDLQEETERP
ncbi:MAG: 3-hydroxyacyl-CoA dehydrogenase family protein, partial [Gemmatimonadota bacterium]